jgi:hypothetical protein
MIHFKFYLLLMILLNSMLLLTTNNDIVHSQKVNLPKSYNLQNSTTFSSPSVNAGEPKIYTAKPESYCARTSSSQSIQLTSNPSYTITNATTTLKEKLIDGSHEVNPVLINQTVVMPLEKTIRGK